MFSILLRVDIQPKLLLSSGISPTLQLDVSNCVIFYANISHVPDSWWAASFIYWVRSLTKN